MVSRRESRSIDGSKSGEGLQVENLGARDRDSERLEHVRFKSQQGYDMKNRNSEIRVPQVEYQVEALQEASPVSTDIKFVDKLAKSNLIKELELCNVDKCSSSDNEFAVDGISKTLEDPVSLNIIQIS